MRIVGHRLEAGALLAVALTLSGCTTVTILDRDGGLTVTRHLLTVGLRVEAADRSQALQARGVGFFASPVEIALGAYRTELAVLGNDCRAVFWINSAEQAQALTQLADFDQICITHPLLTPETSP